MTQKIPIHFPSEEFDEFDGLDVDEFTENEDKEELDYDEDDEKENCATFIII